ncbi:hypothetical protein FQN54_004748 [Arachnomyces sp. PD_36]|nr:hypothetical protein FQN54_004748 [Arachnomyces sp. PD_36]
MDDEKVPKGDSDTMKIENAADESPYTPEEEKKLLRSIDMILMPTIFIMYLLSYMDRTNIGNAKIAGMEDDLNMSSGQYSICLVVFFIGYVVFEVPSNMVLSKTRPSIFLPAIMVLWGTLTCLMAVVKTYKHVLILRVLIGCIEAGFAPGVLLIISSWYKRSEQSKRFAVYISAAILSGAFGGLLAAAIVEGLEGAHGLRGWRWLFIVEGAVTIFFAIVSSFILLDFPDTSKKFTARQRFVAVSRLQSEDVVSLDKNVPRMASLEALQRALTDWRTWMFTVGYMVIVGSSTLTYFYPTLVQGLGYTTTKSANYMTVPIYGSAFVCTAVSGYFGDKVPQWRGVIIAAWLTFSMICAIVVCAVYDFTARYVLLVLMASGLWATNAAALSYSSSSIGDMPPEVRGISLAVINGLANLAQIYGSYLFPSSDEPKYIRGFSAIAAMLFLGVATYILLHICVRRRNRRLLNTGALEE